ncbi:hypothetical protein [Flavobacterium sp. HJJ]|uniref:hypothetical protein n=1 Tax=Flavobacterium sp. HJJ TaxID=2783792 RepID=UPI00188D4034|nr:hypothetical protein [Flavobacterium sp. HJJ]MBF4473009.1 hypothetical protein [Flavobacterium sp. HJJ]
MKIFLPISFLFILYGCVYVPQATVKKDIYSKQDADNQEREFNLQVKTVSFSDKNKYNEIEIEYELKNNSKLYIFDKKLKNYTLFFILKMKDGREIAKEKKIWSIIPPNTAIIEKENIYVSDYLVQSCTTRIYTTYR